MFLHENSVSRGEDCVFHDIDMISRHVVSFMEHGTVQSWVDCCWDLVEANSSRFREQGLQDLAMSVIAGELSRQNKFPVMLEELHQASLENMREGSSELLLVLKDVVYKLRALGLDTVVNTTSYEAIRKHLNIICQEITEESNGGTLQSVLQYMDNLNEYFLSVGMDKNDWLRQLGNPVFEVVQRQTIGCLFDLVIDYPDSLPALDDLKECIKQTREYAVLIQDFGGAIQSRLLHPGASTLDIIQHYISTIKVLQYIEPSGYILDIICKPIQRYLRSRKDAIKNIVILLTDTGDDSFLPSAQAPSSKFYDTEQEAFDSIGTWHPAPLEIAPKNSSVELRRRLDTMSLLTDIYGTKELFLSAYRSMLAERLIHKLDFECDKELKTLELLKIRFGEGALQNAEIMMRDVNESKRLNAAIQKIMLPDNNTERIRVLVTSDQYWPSSGDFDFNLPDSVNSAFTSFGKQYHDQKTPRILRWKKSLGEVSLKVTIGGELVDFKVSPLQASIIMAFGEKSIFDAGALCDKFGISESLLMQNAILWLNEGIISYDKEKNEFSRNDAIIRPLTAMDVEGDQQDEHGLDTSMAYLEPFITGMLTNFDALPLERIHNMLKMFVTDPPYDRSIEDLSKFLSTLTDAITLEGKNYKLVKH
jgi:anaphase-promoting complex subunit 2